MRKFSSVSRQLVFHLRAPVGQCLFILRLGVGFAGATNSLSSSMLSTISSDPGGSCQRVISLRTNLSRALFGLPKQLCDLQMIDDLLQTHDIGKGVQQDLMLRFAG